MRNWPIQVVVPIAAAGGMLLAVLMIGDFTRASERSRQRGIVDFSEIECPSPDGKTQSEFLDEVQYAANLPNQMQLLDDKLTEKVAAAFTLHPQVKEVQQVQVTSSGKVRVGVTFREPTAKTKSLP